MKNLRFQIRLLSSLKKTLNHDWNGRHFTAAKNLALDTKEAIRDSKLKKLALGNLARLTSSIWEPPISNLHVA
ncbi:hypothetical protein NTG1052_90016 [Candidatus Nitrotoga sp. 1052]|nr:hypothetical protein NTG1052_90016 [Candidatus Nitrotoga sp. 1052]